MTDYFARVDITKLYPPFLALAKRTLEAAEASGSVYIVTSGFRSVEEQDALFAKGRTAPGIKVTKAPGGYSAHNYGCGIDGTADGDHDKAGLQPDYSDAAYQGLGAAAAPFGLEWGGTWTTIHDLPHIQLPLKAHGLGWDTLLKIYHQGGIKAVWARFDKERW
jgi:peptidoglycan L-alanyl-D-glutamate endopeptidase CwlK